LNELVHCGEARQVNILDTTKKGHIFLSRLTPARPFNASLVHLMNSIDGAISSRLAADGLTTTLTGGVDGTGVLLKGEETTEARTGVGAMAVVLPPAPTVLQPG
jgi:hypothetical protein